MRLIGAGVLAAAMAAPAVAAPHNVILFVADGLRAEMVTEQTAPTIHALMRRGVRFANTHSMFPTFTTANASALATGHLLGDTGDFSNTIDVGFMVAAAGGSVTPFVENDAVLGELDAHFAGDYLHQETVMAAARAAGLSTATIGKLGPVLIQDHTARDGESTIVVDDTTGRPGGIPLGADMQARLQAASLPLQAPTRGANAPSGDFQTPGTTTANIEQQDWFVSVTTQAVLPVFKQRGKPFMLVFWSRDADGSQHNQGDSLNRLVPGINGPTSLAAIRNADHDLQELLTALRAQGLEDGTDVIVTADHGFSTISKESATSYAATQSYKDVVPRLLPPGFLAIDLAHGLDLPLLDPDAQYQTVAAGAHPSKGNGVLGDDKDHAKLSVAANGGSDLGYVRGNDRDLAARAVAVLSAQDYVSGLFVDDALGPIPGTLPLSAIGLKGSAATPTPSIVVNFRSFTTGCDVPLTCGAEVSDTGLQQGQGMHGSFSRADTFIPGAAAGPDFRAGFTDTAPTSNADIGRTIAHVLGVKPHDTGKLTGRVLTEALAGSNAPAGHAAAKREVSPPDANGHQTVIDTQTLDGVHYIDAAGYPGRTLGLDPAKEAK